MTLLRLFAARAGCGMVAGLSSWRVPNGRSKGRGEGVWMGTGCSAYTLVQYATCNDNTSAPPPTIICAARTAFFGLANFTNQRNLISVERGRQSGKHVCGGIYDDVLGEVCSNSPPPTDCHGTYRRDQVKHGRMDPSAAPCLSAIVQARLLAQWPRFDARLKKCFPNPLHHHPSQVTVATGPILDLEQVLDTHAYKICPGVSGLGLGRHRDCVTECQDSTRMPTSRDRARASFNVTSLDQTKLQTTPLPYMRTPTPTGRKYLARARHTRQHPPPRWRWHRTLTSSLSSATMLTGSAASAVGSARGWTSHRRRRTSRRQRRRSWPSGLLLLY